MAARGWVGDGQGAGLLPGVMECAGADRVDGFTTP